VWVRPKVAQVDVVCDTLKLASLCPPWRMSGRPGRWPPLRYLPGHKETVIVADGEIGDGTNTFGTEGVKRCLRTGGWSRIASSSVV
jgi:hypothetical protein